jgi:DNA sulfur modification protein DndD
MWIEQLVIKNYRQYKHASIDFSPPGKNGFTIIQGANGSGKTNLLNAITWCLYAREYHLSPKYIGLPPFHSGAADRLRKGETDAVEVRIVLREHDENRIVITRTLKFRAKESGNAEIVPDPTSADADGSKLSVIRQVRKDMQPVSDPRFVVQRLIPEAIEEYFLFDGEHLDRYFKETSGQQIQDAVFKISQLGLLERLIDHLRKKQQEFIRDQKGLSPQAEKYRRDLEVYEGSLEKLTTDIEELKKRKGEAERREKELSDKLKLLGPENISRLQDEREGLDADLKNLDSQMTKLEEELKEILLAAAPAVLTRDALSVLGRLIDQTAESGEIPPEYRQSFLNKLLRDEKCICGTELKKGSPHFHAIAELASRISVLSEMSDEIIGDGGNVRRLETETLEFPRRLDRVNNLVQSQQTMMKRKSERLAEIQELIGSSDVEAVKRVEEEIERYRSTKDGLIYEIGSKEDRLVRENVAVENLRSSLEKELTKEKQFAELKEILLFSQNSLTAAERIKGEIMLDVRREIEEKTRSYFLGLIWKKDTYKSVAIDENYNVSVVHQSGREALGTLSAGERQVLALSFVAALNKVSGFDLPIIIDTPLARISSEPRRNIALRLPTYLAGKQVILLVTEEEYTDEVRQALKPSIGKEWVISYRELKSGAEAEVVGYGKR